MGLIVIFGYEFGHLTFQIVGAASCLFSLLHFDPIFPPGFYQNSLLVCIRVILFMLHRIRLFRLRYILYLGALDAYAATTFLINGIGFAERVAL